MLEVLFFKKKLKCFHRHKKEKGKKKKMQAVLLSNFVSNGCLLNLLCFFFPSSCAFRGPMRNISNKWKIPKFSPEDVLSSDGSRCVSAEEIKHSGLWFRRTQTPVVVAEGVALVSERSLKTGDLLRGKPIAEIRRRMPGDVQESDRDLFKATSMLQHSLVLVVGTGTAPFMEVAAKYGT